MHELIGLAPPVEARRPGDRRRTLAVLPTRAAYPHRGVRRAPIVSGSGCFLRDAEGREYLDAACGSGSMIFGHGDRELADLLAEQAAALTVFPGRDLGHGLVETYADALVAAAPEGLTRATFFSSGSDAVEAALKLALQVQGLRGAGARHKVIGRRASYHGNTLAGLAAGGFVKRRAPFEAALVATRKADAPRCGRCDLRVCRLACAESVEAAILAEDPATVAAVIVEPVVGAALSATTPADGYLQRVREICDRHGVLLIVDEVMTGFGRTGRMFAVEHWGVRPDIMVLGKAISAGYYPLSAIVVGDELAQTLEDAQEVFQNAHTHACSPPGCAVGLEVLRRLHRDRPWERAAELGLWLRSELSARSGRSWIGEVRGLGLMIGVELGTPDRTPPPGLSAQLQALAVDEGLLIYGSSGSAESEAGEHFLLLPPLTLTPEQARTLVARLDSALARLDVAAPRGCST